MDEDPRYLSEQLITYLGNKRRLLPFLRLALDHARARLGDRPLTILDAFAGSGIVSRFFMAHADHLISNDLEPYAEVIARCYLTHRSQVDLPRLQTLRDRLEAQKHGPPGWVSRHYAPADLHRIRPGERAFYTPANARILDTLRAAIDRLPPADQPFFLAPLLAQASVHANTSGVFKGFYKDPRTGLGCFGGRGRHALSRILGEISLPVPVFSRFTPQVSIHRRDANALVRELPPLDLAYLDPPYNQHPYGSNYFMLNLLTQNAPPQHPSPVSGIPRDWTRSRYNQRPHAADALRDLLDHTPAKLILLSYNDEGLIPAPQLEPLLAHVGRVTRLEQPYATFRGSRNLRARNLQVTELLYVIER